MDSKNTSCNDISDHDLIKALKSTGAKEERRLFTTFYHRYLPYVYKISLNLCLKYKMDSESAQDLTQETFVAALKKISEFKLPDSSQIVNLKKILGGWLGKIANRIFIKSFLSYENKRVFEDETLFQGYNEIPFEDDNLIPSNINLVKLNHLLESLSLRERQIIITYAIFECIDNRKHPPKNIISALCKEFDLTPSNLRQIKSRILKKIKQNLKE